MTADDERATFAEPNQRDDHLDHLAAVRASVTEALREEIREAAFVFEKGSDQRAAQVSSVVEAEAARGKTRKLVGRQPCEGARELRAHGRDRARSEQKVAS